MEVDEGLYSPIGVLAGAFFLRRRNRANRRLRTGCRGDYGLGVGKPWFPMRTWQPRAGTLSWLRAVVVIGMAAVCVVACSSSADSPRETERPASTVTADGFVVESAAITVSGSAGVAPVGTQVSVAQESMSSPVGTAMFRPFDGSAFDVRLAGGDLQPQSPIHLQFSLDAGNVEDRLREGATLVVLARSATGELDLLPAHWDGASATLNTNTTHLSGFWPGWLDVGAVRQGLADGIAAAMGLRSAKPECLGEPAETASVMLSVSPVERDVAWPCVDVSGGKVTVGLHSSSPWVWLVKTSPAVSAFEVHGKDLAGAVAAGIFYEAEIGKAQGASVLVPGDTTTFPFEASAPPAYGQMQVEAGLSLVSVVLAEISAAADLFGVKLGLVDDLIDNSGKLICLATVAETLNGVSEADFAARAGALGRATLDCVGSIGGVAGAVFLGAVTGVVSALFASLGGLWNALTGQDRASFTVTATTKTTVVSDHGFGAIELGMTADEAKARLSPVVRDVTYYGRCRVMSNKPDTIWDLSVWINTTTGRVTGIETPRGTVTDRNVGDGSTAAQVRQAYQRDHTIEEGNIGGQGSSAIIVRPKNSPGLGRYICFPITSDGSIGPPSVGRPYASEGC
ncbi:hypothetical protein [Nocardia sp. NPDC057227]|uniref:hypothetical protein n=1 Tax=Nocardia sp. NPDC057227 TaxID=3346056 RepID=UPI003640DAE2